MTIANNGQVQELDTRKNKKENLPAPFCFLESMNA